MRTNYLKTIKRLVGEGKGGPRMPSMMCTRGCSGPTNRSLRSVVSSAHDKQARIPPRATTVEHSRFPQGPTRRRQNPGTEEEKKDVVRAWLTLHNAIKL